MKKINFSLFSAKTMATAMMAIMSVLTVSCTADDMPSRSPEDTPDTDETIRLETNLRIEASQNYQKVDAADALIKLYKEKVGDKGVVTYQKVDGEISILFKTTYTNETAFKQALRSVTATEADNAVKFTNVSSLELSVTQGNEAVIKYTYTAKSLAGTWKYTKDGVEYTFEITSARAANGNYIASFTYGGKKIDGTIYTMGQKYAFASNETYGEASSRYGATICPKDNENNQLQICLVTQPFEYVFDNAIFTK